MARGGIKGSTQSASNPPEKRKEKKRKDLNIQQIEGRELYVPKISPVSTKYMQTS